MTGFSHHENEQRRQGGEDAAWASRNVDIWKGDTSFQRRTHADFASKPRNFNWQEKARVEGGTLEGGSFQAYSFK